MYGGGHSPGPRPPNFYLHPPQFRHHQEATTPAALTAPEGIISHNRPRTPPTTQRNTTLRHTTTHPPTPPFLPRPGSNSSSSLYRRYPNSCLCRHPSRSKNLQRNPKLLCLRLQTPPLTSSSYLHQLQIKKDYEFR